MTSRRDFAVGASALLMSFVTGQQAWAGSATEQLRGHVDLVLRALDDPELKRDGRVAARRALIRKIAGGIFDFTEITKRALGRHWQARTQAERDEIVQVFGSLLERSYIGKIEHYSGEKIAYIGEVGDDDLVTVRTRIITKQGTEIPVEYRMLQRDGRWLAYDVVIEGVSLVANYRTQFDQVIQRSGYGSLVDKLKAMQDRSLAVSRN